jgi:hypothetical protein
MKQLRLLFALLLVFAISAPAIADVLVERHENSELYKTGQNTYRLDIGGPISNTEPFEIDGALVPESYNWTDADEIAPDVYRLRKGKFGYTIYKAIGCVTIHPIRKRWDVWYQVCSKTPVALDHRQVNSKTLELYKDTPQVRYSMFIGDRGYKINNRLKETYSGPATWEHTYNVTMQGLTRTGRKIYHEGALIGNLPNPFAVGADNTLYPVTETLSGGELTLTFESADTCVKPCDVDPTLTPAASNEGDSILSSLTPTTNFGSLGWLAVKQTGSSNVWNVIIKFDASGVPAGATVDSATLELYWYANTGGDPAGMVIDANRVTQTAWVEGTCTWNVYDTGLSWASAGGDFTGTDKGTQTLSGSPPQWVTWDVTSQTQYAVDSVSGIVHMLLESTSGGALGAGAQCYSKEEAVQTDFRPKFTITYTETANMIITPCKGDRYENNICLPTGLLLPF